MKKQLLFAALVAMFSMSSFAQISSIGLIGDATPGGWDVDTNLVQDQVDTSIWTLRLTLNDGEAKFRANDDWVIDWGSADFPVGTGIQGGDNIQVDSGEYNIKFNSVTGDYNFSRVHDAMVVGLIGSAGPFGWDADTSMVQDTASLDLWSLTIDLTDGEAKFRADTLWDVNWGNNDFPTGVGYQDGLNIPVFAGRYDIKFNSTYGEYDFAVQSSIGIIGSATPGGWDEDTNMYQDQTDSNKFFIQMDLVAGEAKFRKDDDWVRNWGASDYPSGIGVQEGPNIPIPAAGEYFITLDTSTGAYNFREIVDFTKVGLIGSATVNGWDSVTLMKKDANNADLYTLEVSLLDGGAFFTANDGEFVWGASGFPTDTAVAGGDTIPVVSGKYRVSFNTVTGIYNFEEVIIYESIGIIGSATVNGWEGDDIDLVRSSVDSSLWTLRIELLDGEAKFRANNEWVVDWGAGDFPSGVGTQGGANIPITAGDYLISFNSFTGAYNFETIIEYDAISLVGKSGPFGAWPPDTGAENDLFLTVDPDDPQSWSADNVTLTAHMGADDDGVKFRADTSWTINWGAADFPSGIGEQEGDNIVTVAGTFNVNFNSATGEYAFVDPTTSAKDFLKPSAIKIYPNPAQEVLFIDAEALELSGNILMRVYDMSGHLMMQQKQVAGKNMKLNIAKLVPGNYALQITNDQFIIGKRFIVAD